MVQAATIIGDALGLLGVVDPVEALEAEDTALGLRTLNRRISTTNADGLMLVAAAFQSVALTGGDGTVTIGLLGDVAVTRPNRIELGAYLQSGDASYPLDQLNREQWGQVSSKAQTGMPRYFNYESGTAALGTLKFWPVPDGSYTAHLPIKTRLSSFAAASTSYELADAVEEYLVTSLAIDLAPNYGREAPGSVVARMRTAKTLIKRLNKQIPVLETPELQAMTRHGTSLDDFINGAA
jgi:hypothetical protein